MKTFDKTEMSCRTTNMLKSHNINCVEQLFGYSDDDLRDIGIISKSALNEIHDVVSLYNKEHTNRYSGYIDEY